jgi:hypothetical protein
MEGQLFCDQTACRQVDHPTPAAQGCGEARAWLRGCIWSAGTRAGEGGRAGRRTRYRFLAAEPGALANLM